MTEYVPLTDEMLAVFEEGECDWSLMMRRLMWQEVAYWKGEAEKRGARVMRLEVQLDGCGAVAALGYGLDLEREAYGWSASFGEVAELRRKHDQLRVRYTALVEGEDA